MLWYQYFVALIKAKSIKNETVTMLKKLCLPLLCALLLLGCAASSNTLNMTPKIVLP